MNNGFLEVTVCFCSPLAVTAVPRDGTTLQNNSSRKALSPIPAARCHMSPRRAVTCPHGRGTLSHGPAACYYKMGILGGILNRSLGGILDRILDRSLDGIPDGTLDALDGILDGIPDWILDWILNGILDGTLDRPLDGSLHGILDSIVDGILDGILDVPFQGSF